MSHVLVILAIIIFFGVAAIYRHEEIGWLLGFLSGAFFLPLVISVALLIKGRSIDDIPSAIDVYRGRTTLQITYKDSTAIDTVVVFKNEFMEENK